MKHILYILLFLSLGASAQIKVGVNFDKNNHADNSYNVKSDNVKGGWHNVATIVQRDSLLAQFSTALQDGMAVFVRADSSGYIRNTAAGAWNKFNLMSKVTRDSLLALKANLIGGNTFSDAQTLTGPLIMNGAQIQVSDFDNGNGILWGDDAKMGTISSSSSIRLSGILHPNEAYLQLGGTGGITTTNPIIGYNGTDYITKFINSGTQSNILGYNSTTGVITYMTGGGGITALTGAVTGSGTGSVATTLSNSVVGVSNLSATGTPSSTTYLRGDNTWATVAGGGSTLVPTSVQTSNYTASVNDFAKMNTTSGALVVTLPTAPADKSIIAVKMVIQGGVNVVTVRTGGSDVFNKTGGGTAYTLYFVNQGATFQYQSTGAIWNITSDDLPKGAVVSKTLTDTISGKKTLTDTLKETKAIQIGIQSTVPANGTLHIFGNSIANHTGASDVAHSYTNIMCRDLSLTQDNQAISATVLEAASENLANNMVSRKTSIPTYVKGDWLLFDYIMNDINYNYSDFTTTQFKTDMGTILTYATGTKGWPNNRIVFNTNGYIDSAKYISYFSNPAATPARARAFVQATRDEAALFPGVKVADTYSAYLVQGGTNLVSTSDNLHPNDFGHIVSALVTANAIIDTVRFAKQTLAVSGVTELDTLKHKQLNLLNPFQSFLIGQDKYNNIGLLNYLPDSTRAKQFYFDGLRQFGVPVNTLPTAATLSDILVKQNTRLIGMHQNGYFGYYEPMEYATGKSYIENNTGNIEIWVGSTPALAFAFNQNKQLIGTGVTPPNSNPGIWQQYGAQYGAATSSTAGYYTPFYADGTYGDGMSRITNNYGQGRLIFDMSGGTDAASVYMAQLYSNGHFQLQRGGTFTDNPIARLQIKSTTEGVLLPSMTTTQQTAMGYLTSISRSTGGGSYTTAPTVVIGAPNIAGGTQATATCTITSGSVNPTITITNAGTGYTSVPAISFTGGGGSGATAIATISLTTNEGLENWDNVLHRKSNFDGTNFQSTAWVSDLSSYTKTLYTNSSQATVANTVTETTLIPSGVGSLTLPIATTGKQFRALIGGVYSTTAITAGNLTVNVYYGSTLVATGTATGFIAGATNLSFSGNMKITTLTVGGSGTITVDGGVNYSVGNNLARFTLDLNNTGAAVTVANNVTQAFNVKVQWSAASASNTVTCNQFSLEQLN